MANVLLTQMALSTADRVEALVAVDQLRLLAAAAAPALQALLAEADGAGVSRGRAHAAIGVPLSVVRWAGKQRRILEEGTDHQQLALEVAQELLTEAAETGEPGQVQPPYCENISAMP